MKISRLWNPILFFPLLTFSVAATDENTNSQDVTEQIGQQGEALNPRPARSIPLLSKLLFGGTNTYFTLHMGQVPPDHPLIKYPNPIQLTARKTNDKLLIALPLDENGKKLNPKKAPTKQSVRNDDGGDIRGSDMLASASSHHDDVDGEKSEKEILPSPMESAASTLTYTELQNLYEPFIHESPTTVKPKDPMKPALMHLPGMKYVEDEDGNGAVVPVPGYAKIIVTGSNNNNLSAQQAFELPEMLRTPLPQKNDAGNLQVAPTMVSSFQETYLAQEDPKKNQASVPAQAIQAEPLLDLSNLEQKSPPEATERPQNVNKLAYGPPPAPLHIKGLTYGPPPKMHFRPFHRQPPKLHNVMGPLSAPDLPVVVKAPAFRPPDDEQPKEPIKFPQTEHILHLRPPLPIALAKNSQNALPPAPAKDIPQFHLSHSKFHPTLPLAVPTEVILNLRAPPSSNLPLPVPTETILNMRAPLPPGEILHLRPPLPVPAEKFVDESQTYVSSMANTPDVSFSVQPSTAQTPTAGAPTVVPIADLIALGTNENGQQTGINGFPALVETKTVKSDGSNTVTYTPVYVTAGPFERWRGQNLPSERRRKLPHSCHHRRPPPKRQHKPRPKPSHLNGVKMMDNQWNPIQKRQTQGRD